MPKLGSLQIDDGILDAIRDDRLVIFAGAGVSMGSPANLPDFPTLANDIAVSTGVPREENEPVDRFLGRLAHKGIKVHQLAAQHLSKQGNPTPLHLDLLRLYRSTDRVRIVTTNFDLHFETAAQTVFNKCPEVFRSPALPLGRDFRGLVHVHGALTHPDEMVMTDADFGRGYLTEGWARRFLLDVFRNYTVLFVGYRHGDEVMHYLARALPVDGDKGRYVLTDEDRSWNLLGIKPIRFNKNVGENAFQELYDGVRCLTEHVTRGVLEWKSMLAEIANRIPPTDEEAIGKVEQALREVHTTRFLIDEARLPEWPKWLNARKHLDALFENAPLNERVNERDKLLSQWLAKHYAIDHANVVIELIAAHDMRLNPELWWSIGGELGVDNEKAIDDSTLSRWIPILLSSAPAYANPHVLTWLAERCAKQGNIKMALEVFLYMGSHSLMVKPGFNWTGDESEGETTRLEVQTPLRGEHYELNEVWEKQLKPSLAAISQPLLSGIVRQLEGIHHTLHAWGVAGDGWDRMSWSRSAIEPHNQDSYPEALDVLIDAGRDALEWLALNQSALLDAWMEQLVVSDVPLLRRLAIHALTTHPEKSADDRLNWLMTHVELHSLAEHHEVYRAVAQAYPAASSEVKQAVVDAVLRHQLSDTENRTAAERTARAHFDWLDWLHQADPACELVQAALNPIKTTYPDLSRNEHPDMTHWVGPVQMGSRSPWSVEQLLAKSPFEQLEELLNFQGDFRGPDRPGLLSAIQEACKQRPIWAFDLDDAISLRALWESDLWAPMLRGLRNAELSLDDWKSVLNLIARHDLHTKHAYEITELLYALVRDGGKPFALELLDQANIIAFDLWQSLSCDDEEGEINDWLSRAINRTAGVLVEFWITGLSLRLHGKSGNERALPSNYREWFTTVAHEGTIAGGLGRSVLASQVAFLFGLDESWAREHIIPLFTSTDAQKFSQAWDGFLVLGRFNTPLADALQPAFLAALPRLGTDLADRRRRFIEFFTWLAVYSVDDPNHELLPALFNNNSIDDRINFASQTGFFLRQMGMPARQNLWERWLHRYWQNRSNSVQMPLDESEARQMLEWLPHLGEQYPQGVALAVRASITRIEHTNLTHRMQESDLVTRFPAETAELLIYLCPRVQGYHGKYISMIAKRLPVLDPELQRRLSEAMAHAGFDF